MVSTPDLSHRSCPGLSDRSPLKNGIFGDTMTSASEVAPTYVGMMTGGPRLRGVKVPDRDWVFGPDPIDTGEKVREQVLKQTYGRVESEVPWINRRCTDRRETPQSRDTGFGSLTSSGPHDSLPDVFVHPVRSSPDHDTHGCPPRKTWGSTLVPRGFD